MVTKPLQNEADLLLQCKHIEGLTFAQIAHTLQLDLPTCTKKAKGWIGQALEKLLGTTAGTLPLPDFHTLGIELKTIPLNRLGTPAESTFITSISLHSYKNETWENSACYQKLRRILWIPIEGDASIPYRYRRIGQARLWSPSVTELAVLKTDWTELSDLVLRGQVADIHAGMGVYLQVRPKAANARALCYGFNEEGDKILTLPRGFYLRSSFTAIILGRNI